MAFLSGGFKPADTAPYDRFHAPVVPVDPPEQLAAFAADDDLRKAVITAVASLFAVRAGLDDPPAD